MQFNYKIKTVQKNKHVFSPKNKTLNFNRKNIMMQKQKRITAGWIHLCSTPHINLKWDADCI